MIFYRNCFQYFHCTDFQDRMSTAGRQQSKIGRLLSNICKPFIHTANKLVSLPIQYPQVLCPKKAFSLPLLIGCNAQQSRHYRSNSGGSSPQSAKQEPAANIRVKPHSGHTSTYFHYGYPLPFTQLAISNQYLRFTHPYCFPSVFMCEPPPLGRLLQLPDHKFILYQKSLSSFS